MPMGMTKGVDVAKIVGGGVNVNVGDASGVALGRGVAGPVGSGSGVAALLSGVGVMIGIAVCKGLGEFTPA